ncbi:MAG TPA: 6-phosphogluconolactonase [Verrucomicrobiae bacterium]|jgi:6-phosphogluconolactonase/glucosamine-6-phosphate isomerase/deaminase|nr:6-phosphogluconolactonase [Verrucomicrobiae bacterium]
MKYILTAGWDDGVADLTRRLAGELDSGQQVLWLVSGGSNISASVQIMGNVSAQLSQHLSIMLADERYGPVGHTDSNWAQLLQAGFNAKQAKLLPILEADKTFEQTIEHYNELATSAFDAADVVIAQLGIGEDGHIAGILPDSPATQQETALVSGYESSPLKRLTLTFPALRRITAAYAFAFGANKQAALVTLQERTLELSQQPSQILKQLPEAYLYSDQLTTPVAEGSLL